jgi:hypothetical protein
MLAAGCAARSDDEDDDVESTEAHVEVAPAVIVADQPATLAAEVLADSIRIPSTAGKPYANLAPGTVFVGARGDAHGKNPDGFLRRVDSARTEGDVVILMTHPATLTDAVVDGVLSASTVSGTSAGIDNNELKSTPKGFQLDLDFSKATLFDNVDEVEVDKKKTRFAESIHFEHAHLAAAPAIDIQLEIHGGKVTRFISKIEGQVDLSIAALTEVKIDVDKPGTTSSTSDPLPNAIRTALREKRHSVSQVVYDSGRLPLPTFNLGNVPVSTSVAFTVTLRCDLAFGGPLRTHAGVDGKSTIRLAALQQDGVWSPPSKSAFDLKPSFTIDHGSDVDAHCELEMAAELGAFGATGVTMSVTPYVDFGVHRANVPLTPTTALRTTSTYGWTASAGATSAMHGQADVFGVGSVELPIATWKAQPLTGVAP